MHCFTYGTLMCREIMDEVCAQRFQAVSGTVFGVKRLSVRDEPYPGLVLHDVGQVEGVLYLDVSQSAWLRLDHFEGEMYQRHSVQVALADGRVLDAETYLIRPDFISCLEANPWSFEAFLVEHKQRFQNEYRSDDSLG